ncbi:MAG: xanthine dehydrogenase family protein subunit M [Candidatus Caldatribacteriota bacterium]
MDNHHLKNQKDQYFSPQQIPEALEILSKYGKEIKIIAGGTDLLVQYYDRLYEITGWLDLKNLTELKKIELNSSDVSIGAMVTHSQLEKSPPIKKYFPILSQAAAEIGSPQIRNRGTIGGNIVNASPAGDLLSPLIAYETKFVLLSQDEESIIPAEQFFTGPKKTILKPNQLLSQVILPLPPQNCYSSWIKVGKRRALAISTLALAIVVKMSEDNQIIQKVKVCLSSVAPTPVEIKEVEEEMIGKSFNQLNFVKLGQIVKDKISPIDDIRGTKEYRKEVARRIMIHSLEEIYSCWRSKCLPIN